MCTQALGDSCTLSCNVGYYPRDGYSLTSVCQSNKAWSVLDACYVVDCGPLPAVTGYDELECINTTYSANCRYNCSKGYSGVVADVTCLANGQWSTPHSCTINSCTTYSPPPEYAIEECSGATYGATCALECSMGYYGDPANSTCDENSVWSAASGCTRNETWCAPYTLPIGYDSPTTCGRHFDSNCQLSCAIGYKGSPSPLICQANHSWTDISGCSIITCPAYTLLGGESSSCNGTL